MYPSADQINELIQSSKKIVIIQADNPDGDSLGSSVALEQILTLANKDPLMFCGVSIPSYLQYIPGWDRVNSELPSNFDLSIIVDTSAISLLDSLTKKNLLGKVRSRPCIIIDHHTTEKTIDFATISLNIPTACATGEVIYELAKQLNWANSKIGNDVIAAAILSDSLGLTVSSVSARSVHIIGELVETGVSLSALENARRDHMRKSSELVHYKGQLLERIEYFNQDKLALLTIPWKEIEQYSPFYNPAILALDDMRLTINTIIAVVLKEYPNGKITGKIRSNYGYPLANKLAEKFGGGGHEYASGFKLTDNIDLNDLKQQLIVKCQELFNESV